MNYVKKLIKIVLLNLVVDVKLMENVNKQIIKQVVNIIQEMNHVIGMDFNVF